MVMMVVAAGAILASTLTGCMAGERIREERVPYPVVVAARPPAPRYVPVPVPWYARPPRPAYVEAPRPWFGAPRPLPRGDRWKYAERDERRDGYRGGPPAHMDRRGDDDHGRSFEHHGRWDDGEG